MRLANDRSSEDSRWKASQVVLFAYNQQGWANFCLDLWVMRQQYDRNMVIESRKPASWIGRDFVDKVLLPLIQIRDLSNMVIKPDSQHSHMQEEYMNAKSALGGTWCEYSTGTR